MFYPIFQLQAYTYSNYLLYLALINKTKNVVHSRIITTPFYEILLINILQYTVIVVVFDVLLYDNDVLGLVARHWHAIWLYSFFAVKLRVDPVVVLVAFKVKSSSPHIQLHTIGGFPKVLKLHCKMTESSSSTFIEGNAVKSGSVGGASE